ncbi:hypothetical protein HN00_06325 [Limosilactobacillus reuteri]|nr:hypothetical protein HN00_06325 [Limosilactobacillus reuteri]
MNKRIQKNIYLTMFYIAISILFVFPYIKWHQLSDGWDMIFHLRRINELAMNLKGGYFYLI